MNKRTLSCYEVAWNIHTSDIHINNITRKISPQMRLYRSFRNSSIAVSGLSLWYGLNTQASDAWYELDQHASRE